MVTLRHISEVVDDLRRTNQELRDALNKGRGALWLAMLAAGVISAAVTTAVKRLIGL
ncbi:MAG: hypothetical protein RML32_04080 [Gammaproteobacteria bacterium]|nr:hypothetical protein [Gammaproteobacteria bacterium]